MSSDILKWTWAAFALTVATGLTMFSTNARIYYHNPFFRTKMLLACTRRREHAFFRDNRWPNIP